MLNKWAVEFTFLGTMELAHVYNEELGKLFYILLRFFLWPYTLF